MKITKEYLWQVKKPRFNAHQTGTGAHKSKKKYTRKRKHKGASYE